MEKILNKKIKKPKEDELKKYAMKYRISLWSSSVIAAIVMFVFGTFYPNQFALLKFDKMKENEFTQRFVAFTEKPKFSFADNDGFIKAVNHCVDYLNYSTDKEHRIPHSMITGMAIVESAYGTSRFAKEGNALFGVRTWDLKNVPHMKPLGIDNAQFGVKKYETKCDSVEDMIRILNNHPAYEKFRAERKRQIKDGYWDVAKLLDGITAWSTNPKYKDIILAKIRSKNIKD